MADYTEEALGVIEDIKEAGRLATLRTRVVSGSAIDPTVTVTDKPIYILQTKGVKAEYDQGLITTTSKVHLVGAEYIIDTNSKIVDGQEYNVTHVGELRPGEQVIMYRVIVDA